MEEEEEERRKKERKKKKKKKKNSHLYYSINITLQTAFSQNEKNNIGLGGWGDATEVLDGETLLPAKFN